MDHYPPDPFAADTTAPYKRTIGHEVEYSAGSILAQKLHELGLTDDDGLHNYQCGCGTRTPIHSTEDSTARGGEYLIGGPNGVLFASDYYIEVIKAFSAAAIEVRCATGERVGMHTHVGTADLGLVQKRLLLRNYLALQDDLLDLASSHMREVRSNGCTAPRLPTSHYIRSDADWTRDIHEIDWHLPGRPTLNFGDYPNRHTVEFRVWNSTRSAWRMYLAGGISSALVQASADGHVAGKPGDVSIAEFLHDYMTPELAVMVHRQKTYKDGLRARGENPDDA